MKGIATVLAFAALVMAATSPALAGGPNLEVAPNQVFVGQMANVYGTGFCPTGASCSPVTIAVETKQVASGVQVGSDGKFHASFTVNEFSGTYHVNASQNGAIQATAGMTVPLTDNRRTSPTPPGGGVVHPPATTQPPAAQSTVPSPGTSPGTSPVADASPAPQPAGSTSGPLSPATSAVKPLLGWVVPLLVLLAVAAAVGGVILWRRRRASG
jgi:hypothetical protein